MNTRAPAQIVIPADVPPPVREALEQANAILAAFQQRLAAVEAKP